jgi:Peroxidase
MTHFSKSLHPLIIIITVLLYLPPDSIELLKLYTLTIVVCRGASPAISPFDFALARSQPSFKSIGYSRPTIPNMKDYYSCTISLAVVATITTSRMIVTSAFQSLSHPVHSAQSSTALWESPSSSPMERRIFGTTVASLVGFTTTAFVQPPPQAARAQVFFDPAQYGDQELRVGAVDSIRESVRRAILKNPQLAPSFYQLALLDGLSYNAQSKAFGPDGKIVVAVLSSKQKDAYTANLQEACLALIDAEKALRKKTAITLADAVAIGGAEAIESIGGPILTVQLGRADTPRDGSLSPLPINLLDGTRTPAEVTAAFVRAGLTEREMTALLAGLLTLEKVEKTRSTDDWKASARPKFREPGKMGRVSEFRRLTEEEIAQEAAQAELEADPDYIDPMDDWYIADSFGSRENRFGQRLGKQDEINEKNFNKYLQQVEALAKQKKNVGSEFGWTASVLLDPNLPTAQTWLAKYAGANLAFVKDLNGSYNAITQLGAVYTGGRYADLLQNKKRKSLNDDGLNLF